VVTLTLVLLLLDYWPLGRRQEGARALIIEKIPLLALSLGVGLTTIATQRAAGAVASLTAYPLEVRLMTAALSTAGYLGKLLFPLGLSPFYVHPGADISRPASLAAALFIGIVTVYALATLRTRPWLTVGWGWYLVMLAPLSGLMQTGYQGMADRFTYLPLIGVVVAGTWELNDRLARQRAGRVLLAAGAAGFLAWCALLTPLQARRWRDTETLFSHALAVDPENWLAHLKLAETARGEGRYGAALPHLVRTVELNPESGYARTLLGVTLGQLGRGGDALRELREAVRRDPGWADGRHNLAVTLAREGRLEEAIFHLRAELLLKPGSVRAHSMLATLLFLTGQPGEAEAFCRRWVHLEPASREARDLLRRILEARDPLSPGDPATPEFVYPPP
jgi:tetratricopeptide (TPR) repeat protein